MNQPKTEEQGGMNPRESFGWIYLLLSAHAICITPFLRVGFGSQAFSLNALAATVLFIAISSIKHAPEMIYFLGTWLAAVIVQRFITLRQYLRRESTHSRYEGFPYVAMRVFRVGDERLARCVMEPAVCGIVAAAVGGSGYEVAGGFLLLGVVTLPAKSLIDMAITHARLRRMRDAAIEQNYFSARFRR